MFDAEPPQEVLHPDLERQQQIDRMVPEIVALAIDEFAAYTAALDDYDLMFGTPTTVNGFIDS